MMINFLSYNSTGLNSVKSDWIQDLLVYCDIHLAQLQEHFMKDKNIDSFFSDKFKDYDSYLIPAYRSPDQDNGRARGGLAQLSSKKIGIRKERIGTNSWRLQAQILHIGNCQNPNTTRYSILWVNVYLPTDPQTINFDETELLEVMSEVENIIDGNEFDDVVLGGDLNYDEKRNSGFVKALGSILERLGLVSVWKKFPIDYTHIHTDLKSTSVLDNFFLSERLLEHVEDAGPLHLGDNLSRHSPIMMKIKVDNIPVVRLKTKCKQWPRRPAWARATEEDHSDYTRLLALKLEEISSQGQPGCTDVKCQSEIHIKDTDSLLLDIMTSVIECSYQCIPLAPRSKAGGKSECSRAFPDWKKNIHPLRDAALFWHSIWISAGRPGGDLHRLMAHSRNQYHYAVRKAKLKVEAIKSAELQEAGMKGDLYFLNEVKKTLGKKNSGQVVPDSLEGEVGEDNILSKFKELYEELYNSCGTKNAMAEIKTKLSTLIDSPESLAEVNKVQGDVVKKACLRMKPGKLDVTESYTSDVFLHAPDILFEQLAEVFRSYLIHGHVTLQILTCAFLPLFKGGKKSPDKFKSYRAIACSSQLLKLFEYVILEVWGDKLYSDSMQFGYKAGVSTTQCSWLVNEVANHFLRRGTSVTACLLDASMAFDKCRFDLLFQKLIDKGLPAIVVRVLIFMYEEQTGNVRLAGEKSDSFQISNGTRQGSVLSPALWSVYLDDLIKQLRSLKLGVHVGGIWLGATAYADDLLLLAPVRSVLAEMVKVCEVYGQQHNMVFSTDPVPALSKTKCMYFCGKLHGVKYPDPVYLDGKILPWVVTAEHLGHTLSQSGSMDKDCKTRRAIFIQKSLEVREKLHYARPVDILKAVSVYCCDSYGSMLWSLRSGEVESYFKSWNTCVKLLNNVPRNTFTYLVEDYFAKGQPTLRNQVLSRYCGFFHSLLNSQSQEVRLLCNMVARDRNSNTADNLKYIEELSKLSPWSYSGSKIKDNMPVKKTPECEKWRIGLLDTLLTMRTQKHHLNTDTSRLNAMIDSLCST